MAGAKLAVAFVCRRCNALSPMAATLADDLGGEDVAADHAGIDPDGRILPGALTALREVGLDTSELLPSSASRARLEAADVVVAIGLDVDTVTVLDGLDAEDWGVQSPEGGHLAAFREARDELAMRVRGLLRQRGVELDEEIGFD